MNPFGFDRQTQLLLARLHAEELATDWRAANLRRSRDGERRGLTWAARNALGRALTALGETLAPADGVRRATAQRPGTGC
jgi:hypothetical protein